MTQGLILIKPAACWILCQLTASVCLNQAGGHIPKVVFLDAANCPQLTNLGSGTQDLDANVSPYLDRGVLIVGELRRCGVGIPFGVLGNQLDYGNLSTSLLFSPSPAVRMQATH